MSILPLICLGFGQLSPLTPSTWTVSAECVPGEACAVSIYICVGWVKTIVSLPQADSPGLRAP